VALRENSHDFKVADGPCCQALETTETCTHKNRIAGKEYVRSQGVAVGYARRPLVNHGVATAVKPAFTASENGLPDLRWTW
jgi:hypothetical protein